MNIVEKENEYFYVGDKIILKEKLDRIVMRVLVKNYLRKLLCS